jgi:hypothetical protein
VTQEKSHPIVTFPEARIQRPPFGPRQFDLPFSEPDRITRLRYVAKQDVTLNIQSNQVHLFDRTMIIRSPPQARDKSIIIKFMTLGRVAARMKKRADQ